MKGLGERGLKTGTETLRGAWFRRLGWTARTEDGWPEPEMPIVMRPVAW